jgi:hypothetical protein
VTQTERAELTVLALEYSIDPVLRGLACAAATDRGVWPVLADRLEEMGLDGLASEIRGAM